MKVNDNLKIKLLILLLSSILVGIFILLYFLDNSLEWNAYKILSCVIVNLWIFFIIPALRNSYLFNKDKTLEEWFRMGFKFGSSGIAFPILLAPYFGAIYYIK